MVFGNIYNMNNLEYFGNAGNFPGAHAEIRALNDLAKKKWPNTPPSDEVFNLWLRDEVLGYNRNIEKGLGQENVIMHTCVDCFHILDLIKFINPLN